MNNLFLFLLFNNFFTNLPTYSVPIELKRCMVHKYEQNILQAKMIRNIALLALRKINTTN